MEIESEFSALVDVSVAEEKAKEGASEGELSTAVSEAPEAPSRACLVAPTQIFPKLVSQLAECKPRCRCCAQPVDPVGKGTRFLAKTNMWQCSKCCCRHVGIIKTFGSTKFTEINELDEAEKADFWCSLPTDQAGLKREVAKMIVKVRIQSRKNEVRGKFLPMSVWVAKGFSEADILKVGDDDIEEHPVVGRTYRLKLRVSVDAEEEQKLAKEMLQGHYRVGRKAIGIGNSGAASSGDGGVEIQTKKRARDEATEESEASGSTTTSSESSSAKRLRLRKEKKKAKKASKNAKAEKKKEDKTDKKKRRSGEKKRSNETDPESDEDSSMTRRVQKMAEELVAKKDPKLSARLHKEKRRTEDRAIEAARKREEKASLALQKKEEAAVKTKTRATHACAAKMIAKLAALKKEIVDAKADPAFGKISKTCKGLFASFKMVDEMLNAAQEAINSRTPDELSFSMVEVGAAATHATQDLATLKGLLSSASRG